MKNQNRIAPDRLNRRANKNRSPQPRPQVQSLQKPIEPRSLVEELRLVGRAFEKSEGTFSAQRASFLAKIVIVAQKLVADEDAWTLFCAADFWRERERDKPRAGTPSKVLLRCFQVALNAQEHTQKVAASRFAKALNQFVDAESSQQEIATAITEAGGIDGLLKQKRDPQDRMTVWIDPADYATIMSQIQEAPVESAFKIIAKVEGDESGARWLSLRKIVPLKVVASSAE